MIPVFKHLKKVGLLKSQRKLIDLGCGDGKISEPFFQYGYEVTLVDRDRTALSEAENNFKKIKEDGFKTFNVSIEDFSLDKSYDGIILSNVLPFQKNKETIEKIIKTAYDSLNKKGFLYFTLFGINDQWATERVDTMSFYNKEQALNLIKEPPYFISEDYGTGSTKRGEVKTWHIFYLLYIKD